MWRKNHHEILRDMLELAEEYEDKGEVGILFAQWLRRKAEEDWDRAERREKEKE